MLERRNSSYLDPVERRALAWIAARLPDAVTPDMLTWLGFLGTVCTTLCYWGAGRHPAWLWLATLGIAINWFGDSLDGTVARLRLIERPRYGFFFDNSIDLVEQALLAAGLGLSGYIRWDLTAAGLAAFFMASILGWIQARVSNVLDIAGHGIGLTEIRCALVLWNVAIFFFPPRPFEFFGVATSYPNLLAVIWLLAYLTVFLITMVRELRRLAVEDPPLRPENPARRIER